MVYTKITLNRTFRAKELNLLEMNTKIVGKGWLEKDQQKPSHTPSYQLEGK